MMWEFILIIVIFTLPCWFLGVVLGIDWDNFFSMHGKPYQYVCVALLLLIIYMWTSNNREKAEFERNIRLRCYKNNICSDILARQKSEDRVTVVVSNTGKHYFNGDLCKNDCAGHEAGYEWALENKIFDANKCGGESLSFIEGCRGLIRNSERDDYYERKENQEDLPEIRYR